MSRETSPKPGEALNNQHMTADERLSVAFHEAGHLAMIYWCRESLHARKAVLHAARFGGSTYVRLFDSTEWDLMVLLGGPMAEFLARLIEPDWPLRFEEEYEDTNSDSSRIRHLVKMLCGGNDDTAYQFQVQERCREIIEEPRMWQAITEIAEWLVLQIEISGEECDFIFEQCDAQQYFDDPGRYPPILP